MTQRFEVYVTHHDKPIETLVFDTIQEVCDALLARGFRFLWSYDRCRVVLFQDGGFFAQVFAVMTAGDPVTYDKRDVTHSLNARTNLPILY